MDEIIGTMVLFCGTQNPANWLDCDGKVLPIQQNQVLYSLLGNRFGGKESKDFALPKMPKVGEARYIICVGGRYPSQA